MIAAIRRFWALPRSPGAPARVSRDWWLVGILLALSVVEVLGRTVPWLAVSAPMALIVIGALLFRRTHPLTAVLVAYGTVLVVNIVSFSRLDSVGLYTTAAILVLSYALCRWGSGREVTIGMAVVLLTGATGILEFTNLIGVSVMFAGFLLA